jgi:hypothetical protein
MTLHPVNTQPHASIHERSADFEAVLGDMTAALARGEVAQGTRLMEHALDLNVRWEQLTSAVHAGIERGYEYPATDPGAR